MNLGQAIHAHWAADATLNALLPAATKLNTGLGFDPTLPYATILRTGSEPISRANDGVDVSTIEVAVTIYSDVYDTAAAIADAVVNAFRSISLTLAGTDAALCVDAQEPTEEQDEATAVWKFKVPLHCLIVRGVAA